MEFIRISNRTYTCGLNVSIDMYVYIKETVSGMFEKMCRKMLHNI